MSEPASVTYMRELAAAAGAVTTPDLVNHPPHYTGGKTETIEIIEQIIQAYEDPILAFLVGQVLKYLARAPHKGALEQDLRKARWYLMRAVDRF